MRTRGPILRVVNRRALSKTTWACHCLPWLWAPAFAGAATAVGMVFSNDPNRHIRQAFELAQEHIALHDRADIFRRAGIDDIARLEFKSFRKLGYLLRHA